MKAYKVFLIENGDLVSAFEGYGRKLYYEEDALMIDPKPDKGCIGLAILTELEAAKKFLFACLGSIPYVLHEIYYDGEMRRKHGEHSIFSSAEVDSLIVGKRVGGNRGALRQLTEPGTKGNPTIVYKVVRVVRGDFLSANTLECPLNYKIGITTHAPNTHGIACYNKLHYAMKSQSIKETMFAFNDGNDIAILEAEAWGKAKDQDPRYRNGNIYEGGVGYHFVKPTRLVRTFRNSREYNISTPDGVKI